MHARRRSSIKIDDSHACFMNRSRQLITATREHISKLNDMSTEVREMTERLFTEETKIKKHLKHKRRSSVKLETKLVNKNRASAKQLGKKSVSLNRRRNLPTSHSNHHDKNCNKYGVDVVGSDSLLEVNTKSSIHVARSRFACLDLQSNVSDSVRGSKQKTTSPENDQDDFGYKSTREEHESISTLRSVMHLPQLNLSTTVSISTPGCSSSTPRSTGKVSWNSRSAKLLGSNNGRFSPNRYETVPFRYPVFNQTRKS